MGNDSPRENVLDPGEPGKPAPRIRPERRLGKRYALILSAEIEDLLHGTKVPATTSDLSVHGCYLDTLNPCTPGTRIRIHLQQGSQTFQSLGVVIYAHEGLGMGVSFQETDDRQQTILQNWVQQCSSR